MQAKSVMYAAVGAPVMAARKAGEQVSNLKTKWEAERADYTKVAEKKIADWASEGEKVVARISEGKVVEEISSKVDLDQAKEQVTKLRDQLEDMLATWRTSFRPAEKKLVKTEVEEAVKPPASKAPATKAPATKSPASKPATKSATTKTSAAKTTKSPTAAKTSTAKATKAS